MRIQNKAPHCFLRRIRNGAPATAVITLFSLVVLFFLLCIIAAIFDSCQSRERVELQPHWFKYYQHYNEKAYVQFIEDQINNEHDTSLFATVSRDFYRSRHHHPFWTQKGLQESLTESLLGSLRDAFRLHGIPNDYFGLDSIRHAITQLVEHQVPNNDSLYSYLYRLERQLTNDYVRYACALAYGATNPKAVHGNKWYYKTLSPDSAFVRNTLDNIHRFAEYLPELYPKSTDYQALQKELERLLSQPDTLRPTLPDFRVRKGGRSNHIGTLCERLNHHGISVDINYNTLNDTVLQALNTFRARHGIPESDTLDSETIEKLNMPLRHYCNTIAANLERMRWQRVHQKSDDTLYIAVNIPDYTLCVVQKDRVVMRNKICCGRTQNPEGVSARHRNGLVIPYKAETPLMYSLIRSIILNPEWNIPYDIIKNEYYHKLVRSNTAVVNREHLYIRDSRNGKYVVPDSINWSRVSQGNIPYRLHQTSGRYNALGLYKFVFANSESVYLHDTNNKGAFKRRKRALSHGCVRVQNPDSVAEWVYRVNNFDTNYIEQLHIISGAEPTTEKGQKFLEKREEQDSLRYEGLNDYDRQFYRKLMPTNVNLRKPIPLFIEYYTCFVGEDGNVHYRDDVYYKDRNILYLLENPD